MLSSPASLFCLYSPGYLIHSYTFSISSILKFRILTAPSWTSALNIRPIYTTVYFTTWMSTIHLKLNMLKHSSCCLFPTPTKRKIFSVFFSPPFLLMMVSLFQLHRPKARSFSMFFFSLFLSNCQIWLDPLSTYIYYFYLHRYYPGEKIIISCVDAFTSLLTSIYVFNFCSPKYVLNIAATVLYKLLIISFLSLKRSGFSRVKGIPSHSK